MTKEKLFEKVVLERIGQAKKLTGYSFFGLLKAIETDGAVATARRLIGPQNNETFQDGMKELNARDLLKLSVEQAVIDFAEKGYIFDDDDASAATERLRLVRLLLR
jgi:hypothetical protein